MQPYERNKGKFAYGVFLREHLGLHTKEYEGLFPMTSLLKLAIFYVGIAALIGLPPFDGGLLLDLDLSNILDSIGLSDPTATK